MTWSPRRPARSPRGGTPVTLTATTVMTVMTTAALSGCSFLVPPAAPAPSTTAQTSATDGPTGSDLTPSTGASSATPSGTPAPSPTDTNVATLQGGDGSSVQLVLPDAAAPAGYAPVAARDTTSYRMTVCGVDIEPAVPVDGAQKRWRSGNAYLEEHIRTYSGQTAQDVVAALRKALPTCTKYTNSAGTYTVEKLGLPSNAKSSVGWRQRVPMPVQTPPASTASATAPPTATVPPVPHTLIQDVAVTQKGTSIVLLASYSVDTAPQAGVLNTPLQQLYSLGE